ncbi:zinc-binding dehydrogenase [Capsaspora owczarzaki ATCC 30864]|uniref:zinc-binding dehydrogenase n=1 Tax=Capsaspora owczarzaki (strain ATCC 30864) TaxID=595528 RepID=UPI0001FE6931|nr:zinc-binding dehydrogenase [Capsaspora owczarzaki ATCC 30864]|eukprot:XP_004348846.1 zinc-binding dehydrogenase [Capsaspora owczarzaki ATCC 30864]
MIPGCDFAGIVVGIGQACSGRFKEGDFVFGATRFVGGAMAEYVVCLEEWVAPLPNGVPFHIAAALPTAMLAAYQGLAQANVKAGERVLVLGGSGGIVSGPAYYFINVQISDEDLLACCQLVQQGVVVPHLGRVLQFTQSDVQQAISTLASGRARGKLVVQIAPETTTGVDALSEYARLVSTVTSCTDPAGCACEQPSESLVAAQPPVLPADDQP